MVTEPGKSGPDNVLEQEKPFGGSRGANGAFLSGRLIAKRPIYILEELFAIGRGAAFRSRAISIVMADEWNEDR